MAKNLDGRLARLEQEARQDWRWLARQPLETLTTAELDILIAGLDVELGQDVARMVDRMPNDKLAALAAGDLSPLSPEERQVVEAYDQRYMEVRG